MKTNADKQLKTIYGDPAALYNYVIKTMAPEKISEEKVFASNSYNSYLRYINTAVKRNHDRIVKLTLQRD